MGFPVQVVSTIKSYDGNSERSFTLQRGLTVILGPNGSGKTHLLRGLKRGLQKNVGGKKVRFLSAGRMGMLEQYRSDYDGQRGGEPRYEQATHGRKSDVKRRHNVETLNGDLQTLSERMDILIKVQERLRKLFKRDVIVEWDGGQLRVSFARLDVESEPYSSGREASGLLHLVGILAAIYDDEVGALLIDEPEVSLHPQLQAFLLKEIESVAGYPSENSGKKLVVIATHSTEMVKIDKPADLLSLVFCYDLSQDPVQIPPTAGELKNRKVQTLIARLGQEHKLSLFCTRPLLVEGPSDVMICTALASRANLHLEAAGSQLLPVIGKGQLPVVAKLLRLLGKNPVVLADADGLADGLDLAASFLANNSDADEAAHKLGAASASELVANIYRDFCSFVDSNWEAIASAAEQHSYWINQRGDEDRLAKRRSVLCVLLDEESDSLIRDAAPEGIGLRARLTKLLDILESFGCFFLRRGTIEAYYQVSDKFASVGKPSAAADEMEYIEDIPRSEMYEKYNDVLRCLTYAADVEDICEAEALRDILLAVSASALGKLQNDSSTQDIQLLARSLLGERAKMFDFAVDNGELKVDLRSTILDVSGFPLVLRKGDDVVKQVARALQLEA